MIIPVHMLAFMEDRKAIRYVDIPDEEFEIAKNVGEGLELVFKYGQNCFQPKKMPSISIGDVAEYFKGRYWIVMGAGWKELSKEEFDKLIPPTSLHAYCME